MLSALIDISTRGETEEREKKRGASKSRAPQVRLYMAHLSGPWRRRRWCAPVITSNLP